MENKPVWNNVQRMNHQNQFVPITVLTRTSKIPVSTARASGTNNVNTARHNFNSQAVLTNAARKISTVKPFVNKVRPKTIFRKTHSPFRRPFNNTTTLKTTFTKQKVNTAGVNSVSAIGQNRETVVKTSAGCNWRTKRVLNSPCFMVKSWLVHDQTVHALASPKANELTIPEQTATGKGTSNPLMAGSLPKTTKPT
ncbi:hypothetical protein Tco_0156215 [Tanacetum coccineum]